MYTDVLLIVSALLLLKRDIRNAVAFQLVHLYDEAINKMQLLSIPVNWKTEKMLFAAGGTAFVLLKVKNLRKLPLDHVDNLSFLYSLAIGILLGLVIDINE